MLNFFLKKSTIYETFLIIVLIFWLFFRHQFLNHLIKDMFKFHLIGIEYSSEISLLILVMITFSTSGIILTSFTCTPFEFSHIEISAVF